MKYDYDAAQALLDVEYLWYANEEECSVYDYNGKMVFYYEWVEGEGYYLDLYGNEEDVTDENHLTELALETDDEGYYLLPEGLKDSYPLDEEYIVCPDSISLFYYDEGRYPEITDNLGVMQDYGGRGQHVAARKSRRRCALLPLVVPARHRPLRRHRAWRLLPQRSPESQTQKAHERHPILSLIRGWLIRR